MSKLRLPVSLGDLGMIVALGAAVLAVYWPVGAYEFVNYDDPFFALDPHVTEGLNLDNVGWALTTTQRAHWQPLVWLSYMADVQFFRLVPGPTAAGGHHLVNVALHIANTILLFLVLRRMTLANWASAAVAALFAIHPLHVESVAWISERKDVLSALFWFLTLGAYAWYAERPSVRRYAAVFVLLALGLMAKPMLVTVPFLLLLLDYWPLGRFNTDCGLQIEDCRLQNAGKESRNPAEGCDEVRNSAICNPQSAISNGPPEAPGGKSALFQWPTVLRLVLEKVPLFVLVAAVSVATYVVQKRLGAMRLGDELSVGVRLSSAVVAFVAYLVKTVWPVDLAVIYPYETDLPVWEAAGSAAILIAITALVIWQGRRRPYLPVGWFWYLGTLVPVIGIVQVGVQSMADRYTYVPLVGLFIMVAWGFSDVAAAWPQARRTLAGLAFGVIVVLVCVSQLQVRYWRSSEALYTHTLSVTKPNFIAEGNLGKDLAMRGRYNDAVPHCRAALRLKPEYPETHVNLGLALMGAAQTMNPADAAKAADEAIAEYTTAMDEGFDEAKSRGNIAQALIVKHRYREAIEQCDLALALDHGAYIVHYNRGVALANLGRSHEAVLAWRQALQYKADDVRTALALAWILATDPDSTVRNGEEAVALAEQAIKTRGAPDAGAVDILAAAYAEARRFDKAVDAAKAAEAMALRQDNKSLVAEIRARLELYEAGKSYQAKPVP